jgi:hypothetical protein
MGKGRKAEKSRYAMLNAMIEKGYKVDGRGRLVHRVVCREFHGNYPHNWVVHHIDGDVSNNDPFNLIALPRILHDRLHKAMRSNKMMFSRATVEKSLQGFMSAKSKQEPMVVINVIVDTSGQDVSVSNSDRTSNRQ